MKKILILSIICCVSNTFAMEKNSEDIDYAKEIKHLWSKANNYRKDANNYRKDVNDYIVSNKKKIILQGFKRMDENHSKNPVNLILKDINKELLMGDVVGRAMGPKIIFTTKIVDRIGDINPIDTLNNDYDSAGYKTISESSRTPYFFDQSDYIKGHIALLNGGKVKSIIFDNEFDDINNIDDNKINVSIDKLNYIKQSLLLAHKDNLEKLYKGIQKETEYIIPANRKTIRYVEYGNYDDNGVDEYFQILIPESNINTRINIF